MEVFNNKQINKQNYCQSPSKQLQKMRIQLSDKIFQINKLQEDFAQEKAKHFMDFQKERQSLNKAIKQLKDKNQLQNQEWSKKIQQFRAMSEQNIKKINQQCENKIVQTERKISSQIFLTYEQQISSLKQIIKTNQANYTQEVARIQVDKEKAIDILTVNYKNQFEVRQKQYKSNIEAMRKQSESKVLILQKLFISQETAKQAITKEYQAYIQQKVRQKLQLQNEIDSLKHKVANLQSQVRNFLNHIEHLKEAESVTRRINEENVRELNLVKMRQMERIILQFNEKSAVQKDRYQKQLKQVKEEVKRMATIYSQKQQKWYERGQIVLREVQATNSKTDSLKTIKRLQFELMKKDTLLQKEKQTVKNCKLQLQNMEEIYDKMFVSNNYLYKYRSKSFKVKKVRVCSNQLNQSNNSISIQERLHTEG